MKNIMATKKRQRSSGFKVVINHPDHFEVEGKRLTTEELTKLMKLQGGFWLGVKAMEEKEN